MNDNCKILIKDKLKELISESKVKNSCEYFDMTSLKDYLELEKPLYSIVAKRRTAELEYMSPKQYIYRIAYGFGVSYDDALGGAYDEERSKKYAQMMKDGSKAPIGYYVEGSSGQEGRHRAMAAMINGCDEIPVVKITSVDRDMLEQYANKFKDYKFEELNEEFIKMGFPYGITKLGYNDLMRFIDYNL